MNDVARAWQLVVSLIFSESGGPPVDSSLTPRNEPQWLKVLGISDTLLVTPALWAGIIRLGMESQLPEDVRSYLSAIYDMNARRNDALMEQVDELTKALNATEVVPGLLKGAAHVKSGIFPDSAVRVMTDIDILVPRQRLDETHEVMSNLGYSQLASESLDYDKHHHVAPYCRPGYFGAVEVHHEPLADEAGQYLAAAQYWDDSQLHDADGLRYRTPSATDAVVLAMVHSEVVNRNLRKLDVDLRTFMDVAALAGRDSDSVRWQCVIDRFVENRNLAVLEDFLYLLKRFTRLSSLPTMQVGMRPRARYRACQFVLRYAYLGKWCDRLDTISTTRLERQYGRQLSLKERFRARSQIIASWLFKKATIRMQ